MSYINAYYRIVDIVKIKITICSQFMFEQNFQMCMYIYIHRNISNVWLIWVICFVMSPLRRLNNVRSWLFVDRLAKWKIKHNYSDFISRGDTISQNHSNLPYVPQHRIIVPKHDQQVPWYKCTTYHVYCVKSRFRTSLVQYYSFTRVTMSICT